MKGCGDLQKETHGRRTDAQIALVRERSTAVMGRG